MVRAPLHFHGRIPVPEVAPLTYRDGVTQLELVYELSEYLKNILHPSLQSTVDQVVADAEQLLSDATAQYVDGVQEFQRIHDAFMSDVQASLRALNDTVIADLVTDDASYLSTTLRELFLEQEDTDGVVADHLRNENSETRTVIDTVFNDHPVFGELDGKLGELENEFNQYAEETTNRVDTALHDVDQKIQEIHDTFGEKLDPIFEGVLDAKAVVVTVGSSTATRDEYPAELARHIQTQYQPGVFRTLRRSSWGPDNNELNSSSLPPGAHVINGAWGGSAGADYVDASIAQEISALNPTMVVHSVGANDWFHGRNPDNLVPQIQRVIDMITSETKIWHVLVHQQERTNTRTSVPYEWDDYLESLHKVANQNDNVIVVDAAKPMRALGVGRGLSNQYDLLADGSHLNSKGYRILGRIVARGIGFEAVGGVSDTGWLPVTRSSEHIQLQPQGESSTNEPLMYRVVGDGGGYTTYIRGINTRTSGVAGPKVSFMQVGVGWRNALIPKTLFVNDRHRIGAWHSIKSSPTPGGPIFMRSSGAIHASNDAGTVGSVGFFVDCIIRS